MSMYKIIHVMVQVVFSNFSIFTPGDMGRDNKDNVHLLVISFFAHCYMVGDNVRQTLYNLCL